MGAGPHLAESARKVTTLVKRFHRWIGRLQSAAERYERGANVVAFSIWEAIWLVFVTFLFITVLMMLFSVIVDLFRDDSLSGWGKAGWIIVLIFFPLIGLLVYVIARGKGMTDRAFKEQADAKQSFDAYVRSATSGGPASELEKANVLHSAGKLTDEEFAALKAKILA
jgi:ABC-type multidrug transport system fused ATPase/permease subunit